MNALNLFVQKKEFFLMFVLFLSDDEYNNCNAHITQRNEYLNSHYVIYVVTDWKRENMD